MPLKPVLGEHLVPVVADPAAGPAVPAPARQPHRVGVGRAEERLGHRGTPVDKQPAPLTVGEAKPPDVHGLGAALADDAPEAQVQAEAAQGAQPGGQPVDLHVPVHRLLADAARRLPLGVQAAGQVGDRLLEALRDGGEVPVVVGDQRRVGLGAQVVGEGKRAGGRRVHVISSDPRRPATAPRVLPAARRSRATRPPSRSTHALRAPHFLGLPSACDYAARPGSCRKPRGAVYVESGGACALSFPAAVHAGQASRSRADGVAARLAGPPSKLSLPDSGVRAMPRPSALTAGRRQRRDGHR